MERYRHGGNVNKEAISLDFSANINPLGLPEGVAAAVLAALKDCTCYPDPDCTRLRAALSEKEKIASSRIVCGNGAADLIYRIVRAFHPKRALICAPTFSEYEKALLEEGCKVIYWKLKEKEGFRVTEEILPVFEEKIDLCFLCSPNNPVGNTIPVSVLRKIADKCRERNVTLIVDECFLPFVSNWEERSASSFLYPKMAVLRAFTKIYGMAGLRLGYILCGSRQMANAIKEVGQCWSVSVPAMAAGEAALKEENYYKETIQLIEKERDFLVKGLTELGLTVYPPEANFILFFLQKKKKLISLEEELKKSGIAIRNCENYEGLEHGYYRIAVRTRKENEQILAAFKKFLIDS